MLQCGNSVPFINTHVEKYLTCQKSNTLLTKKSSFWPIVAKVTKC